MLPSELANTIELFIVYVHRNEAHFTYIYVYLRLTTFTKTLPKCHFFFAISISLWGSTHDSADCWSAHRFQAARDTTNEWLGAPPKQKSWLHDVSIRYYVTVLSVAIKTRQKDHHHGWKTVLHTPVLSEAINSTRLPNSPMRV